VAQNGERDDMSEFSDWAKAETTAEVAGDVSPSVDSPPASAETAVPADPESREAPPDAGGPVPEASAPEPEVAATPERNDDGTFKKRDKVQERIDKAVKAQRDAERRAEAAERELQARTSQPATPAAVPDSTPPEAYPTIDQFLNDADPYASLAKAIGKYEAKAAVDAYRQQQQQEAARGEVLERVSAIVEAGQKKYANWQAVVADSDAATIPMPEMTLAALHRLENAEDVIYYLGQHPDEARVLAAHDPMQALLSLGALSRSVVAPSGSTTPAVSTSRAKPLIKPVGATPVAPEPRPPDEKSTFAEHRRYWNERERKEREAQRA
jgi:hypothetical protein